MTRTSEFTSSELMFAVRATKDLDRLMGELRGTYTPEVFALALIEYAAQNALLVGASQTAVENVIAHTYRGMSVAALALFESGGQTH